MPSLKKRAETSAGWRKYKKIYRRRLGLFMIRFPTEERKNRMNNTLNFLVGCFTFAAVMLLKIPVKKLTWKLARRCSRDEEECCCRYRRYNSVLFLLVTVISVGAYYILYRLMNLDHFKLCCTLKAGAIAIAFYAVYEQWTGPESSKAEKSGEK